MKRVFVDLYRGILAILAVVVLIASGSFIVERIGSDVLSFDKSDIELGSTADRTKEIARWNHAETVINGNLDTSNSKSDAGYLYSQLNLQEGGIPNVVDADIKSVGQGKIVDFKCTEQASPNNTVLVGSGQFLNSLGNKTVVFAGGSSATFPDGMSGGEERIDVLLIDDTGALVILAGVASTPPTSPRLYPLNQTPICEVLLRVGFTKINDVDDASEGFIKTLTRTLLPTRPTSVLNAHDNELSEHFFQNWTCTSTCTTNKLTSTIQGAGSSVIADGDTDTVTLRAFEAGTVACALIGAGSDGGPVFKVARIPDFTMEFTWKKTAGTFTNQNVFLGLDKINTCAVAPTPIDGIFFMRDSTAGKFKFVTRSASTDSATAAFTVTETDWNTFRIVMTGGNSVEGFHNGVSVGPPLTTNIPTTSIMPILRLNIPGATDNSNQVDELTFRIDKSIVGTP